MDKGIGTELTSYQTNCKQNVLRIDSFGIFAVEASTSRICHPLFRLGESNVSLVLIDFY